MPDTGAGRNFRLFKGLRFRLAVSYAIFFALLLAGLGFVLRGMLTNVIESAVEGLLEEEWAAVKGFLHVTPQGTVQWRYDPNDKEEAAIVERLRYVYVIANQRGEVLESSELYRDLGFESPAAIAESLRSRQPVFVVRPNLRGEPFMIRRGALREQNLLFFVALGRSFGPSQRVIDQFSFNYFATLPFVVLTTAAFGWFFAGRAMKPISEVAAQAEKVSGSNLKLRVASRGSGDELDHLVRNFNTMVERLDASFTQIRQFSTDVSHELRTPVTVVRGQLEVALMTATSEEELRTAIESALVDIDRLSKIIRALLTLAKAESGQLALSLQEVDLATMTREVVSELEISALDKGLQLAVNTPRSAPILGDRLQIERLLYNLIDNAIKYTPVGGKIEAEVRNLRASGQVVLSVRDNGVGIPPEHLPHLFDRFYRVPARAGVPERGLGLGLNFVSWIVKAHNGVIQVESEVDKGSSFIVSFPRFLEESRPDTTNGNLTQTTGRYSHT